MVKGEFPYLVNMSELICELCLDGNASYRITVTKTTVQFPCLHESSVKPSFLAVLMHMHNAFETSSYLFSVA